MSLALRTKDCPDGYSTSLSYDGGFIQVSFGRCNRVGDDTPAVTVSLRGPGGRGDIRITGGPKLHSALNIIIQQHCDNRTPNDVVSDYLVMECYSALAEIFASDPRELGRSLHIIQTSAYEDGKRAQQAKIREALGL